MKFLILLCILPLALAEREECGENQHYNSCGTMCPLTCKNYMDPPKACVLMCNPGCHCNEGYVKTEDGRCVKPENCPESAVEEECGENQHYESCGTACPLTCRNYLNPPKACILMCKTGCFCDKGYVKTDDGRCVRPENCPQEEQCGANQQFTTCGTACPLTCDNYFDPPKICTLQCVIGCECQKGYVKTRDGHCVRPEECPSQNGVEREACDLPAETGVCRGFFPRYYFDRTTGQCQKFVYGGCGGNENNFKTPEECQKTCGVQASREVCSLPSETGLCYAYFPRYFYNSNTGKCERFVYGGCGGNGNNFKTKAECEKTCGVQASSEVCSLPSEPGLCDAYFPRYFYNSKTGKCERFVYGGCGSNGNNFRSQAECEKTCGVQATRELCSLPSETGLCKAYFPRYFYNSKTGKCESFVYGGCGGNENNFNTQAECEDVCGSS